MKITILGCGSSNGVPVIGCKCEVCSSTDPKNNRTRSSIHIETGDLKLLVDAGPDLRQQALRQEFLPVNTVFFTHAHYDHTGGIDELRSFNYQNDSRLDAIMDRKTYDELDMRYGYCFAEPIKEYGWFRPSLNPVMVEAGGSVIAKGVKLQTFRQLHGSFLNDPEPYTTLGLRIGDVAYSTDVKTMPEEAFEVLKGVKVWVVDCLRRQPAPTHSHLEQTLEWINRLKPKLCVLTHMSHDLEYNALLKSLPENVIPAYDALRISMDDL